MTQPMQSAKISEGIYHVLGTTTECIIEHVNSRSAFSRWRLFSDGRFVRSFRLKREALVYCQEHPKL